MKETHTPGPWHTGKPGYMFQSVRDQDEHIVADVNIVRKDAQGPHNARLIAAAPELLSALEDLVARCIVTYGEDAHYTYNARAAIAKARGE